MTLDRRTESAAMASNTSPSKSSEQEKILCPHCRRTATNGIKCQGYCVADSDY